MKSKLYSIILIRGGLIESIFSTLNKEKADADYIKKANKTFKGIKTKGKTVDDIELIIDENYSQDGYELKYWVNKNFINS